jgi:hypothetical protein
MKHRIVRFGLVLTVATLILTACGNTPTPEVIEKEITRIVLQVVTATPARTSTAEPSPPMSTPAATATPVPPTPTPEAPEGEADSPDFREFAGLVARAAQEHNTAFFADRVKGEIYTCTESDVSGEGLGGAGPDLCKESGQQLDLVLLGYWLSEGVYTRPDAIVRDIENYFANALPGEKDQYGTGDVRIYAIGARPAREFGRTLRVAILTSITSRIGAQAGEPVRTVRRIDFQYVEGRWLIRGMLVADGMADGLLSPDHPFAPPYTEWERY